MGIRFLLLAIIGLFGCSTAKWKAESELPPVVLAIHGGAGTIRRADLTPEQDQAYRAAIENALREGFAILQSRGSALDAVCASLLPLEDSPLFNAGRGAVLTADGHCELDACIMDGSSGKAGAVASLTRARHPVLAARAVMDSSPHVLLAGPGADAFVQDQGLEEVDSSWFQTSRRQEQLKQRLADSKHGTVGAVALDRSGHLAAATSTGGMTAKRWGRVGDSPIVGAGTYANDATCAVSATGWGEYFLRGVLAHEVSSRMRHANQPLVEAARGAIHQDLTQSGGTGGLIALDANGNLAMPFNTEGMYRGWINARGQITIRIYEDPK